MLPARVLLVDDDPLFSRRAKALCGADVDLHVVCGRAAALAATEEWRPSVVVMDSLMADADAMGLLAEIRARHRGPHLGVIWLAKGPGAQTRLESGAGGFFGIVRREAGPEGLLAAVSLALRARARAMKLTPLVNSIT